MSQDPRTVTRRGIGRPSALALGFPMLVETLDDTVGSRYSGMPSRLDPIDRDGKITDRSGRGPFGFKPAELEQSLILMLGQEAGEGKPKRAGQTDSSAR